MFMTLIVGAGVALLVGLAWVRRRRRQNDHLGTISDSWVHQHRASTHDGSR
jgi:LPXTG-motif cell wall-anchored protein